ncbi:MAG: DUF4203 domain-containing protein [Marmoricola sp.]|nr:DUF4203 domain-containing protein [Marmoricola sp.]
MSAVAYLLVGLALCFAGARSVRLAVIVAGFGTTWLLADLFGASASTALVVSVAGALGALVLSFVLARMVFFVAGALVGALLGARFFGLLVGEHARAGDWVLAVVFVPAVAVVLGFLANRMRRRFLVWLTAAAGASMILSGIGRLGDDSTKLLWRPATATGSVVFAVAWVVLTVLGHRVQTGATHSRKKGEGIG